MKLVIPIGRDVSTFQTQANQICRCVCSTSNVHVAGYSSGFDGSTGCGCKCYSGDIANRNGNRDAAYDEVPR